MLNRGFVDLILVDAEFFVLTFLFNWNDLFKGWFNCILVMLRDLGGESVCMGLLKSNIVRCSYII